MSGWEFVVPAVSAASALCGVVLGKLLDWRTERRGWQRDRKYDAFMGIISAARILLWRGDEINIARHDVDIEEQRERVRQAMLELREKISAVALLTDGEPAVIVAEIEDHFGNRLYPYFFSAEKADGSSPLVQEGRQLLTRFRNAARSELTRV